MADLDFDTQEQQLLQQAARIKALRAMGAPADPGVEDGFTSAVTGAKFMGQRIKQSPLAAALPLLSGWTADRQEGEMNQKRKDLSAAEQQNLLDWINKRPQGTPGSPMVPGQMPMNSETGEALAGPPTGAAAEVAAREPSTQDFLSHAAAGMRGGNPLVAPYSKAVIEDQLLKAPERAQALKLAMAKEAATSREAQLKRENDLRVAEIRAKGSAAGMNLQPAYNEHGQLTGGVDSKSGRVFAVDPESGQLVLAGGAAGAGPAGGGGAGAGGGTTGGAIGGPTKASSPQQQLIEKELKAKIEDANDVLNMTKDVRKYLSDPEGTTHGIPGAIMEGGRQVFGRKPTTSDMNAQQLDTIAGQLASKYPRGPGTITDQERKLFVEYMGNVNNRLLHPTVRLKNLDQIEDLMRNSVKNAQAARAGGDVAPQPAAGGAARGAAPVQISGDEEYDKLPKGTRFIGPNGKTYIK